MRGEGGTIPCPGCGEQHRAVYRLDGLAVLDCPSVETPGELRMRSVPRTVHSSTFVFLRGPEHAPVEVAAGDPLGAEHAPVEVAAGDPLGAEHAPVEVAAGDPLGAESDTTTSRRRRTA